MSGYGSGGGYGDDERVSNVLSQDTIDRAIAADAARRSSQQQQQQASSHSHSSHSHSSHHTSNQGDVVPGITRRDTTTRRDPLTGDLIEDYSGSDPNGPAMHAHHNWDEPGKSPFPSSRPSNTSSQSHQDNQSRPGGGVQRTNTIISYSASGDRIEDASGEGSLEIRALYNQDEDTSTTYRPAGPPRGHSEGGNRGHY